MRDLYRRSDVLAASVLAPLDAAPPERLLRAQAEVRRSSPSRWSPSRTRTRPAPTRAGACSATSTSSASASAPASTRSDAAGRRRRPRPARRRLPARADPGQPAGCGALKRLDDETGELMRMWVDGAHRGLGIGARDPRRARGAGGGARPHAALRLYTNGALAEAQALYRAAAMPRSTATTTTPTPSASSRSGCPHDRQHAAAADRGGRLKPQPPVEVHRHAPARPGAGRVFVRVALARAIGVGAGEAARVPAGVARAHVGGQQTVRRVGLDPVRDPLGDLAGRGDAVRARRQPARVELADAREPVPEVVEAPPAQDAACAAGASHAAAASVAIPAISRRRVRMARRSSPAPAAGTTRRTGGHGKPDPLRATGPPGPARARRARLGP